MGCNKQAVGIRVLSQSGLTHRPLSACLSAGCWCPGCKPQQQSISGTQGYKAGDHNPSLVWIATQNVTAMHKAETMPALSDIFHNGCKDKLNVLFVQQSRKAMGKHTSSALPKSILCRTCFSKICPFSKKMKGSMVLILPNTPVIFRQ